MSEVVGLKSLPSSLKAFFKHTCYRHIHHILTFQTPGDTWPMAFYFSKVHILCYRIRQDNTKFTVSFPGKLFLGSKIFQNPAKFSNLELIQFC